MEARQGTAYSLDVTMVDSSPPAPLPAPPQPLPRSKRVLRRLLPLIVMGVTVGVALSMFLGTVHREIDLEITVDPETANGLTELQLSVVQAPNGMRISDAVFRFDSQNPCRPHLRHSLRLRNGSFLLRFEAHRGGELAFDVRREIQVSADAKIGIHVP